MWLADAFQLSRRCRVEVHRIYPPAHPQDHNTRTTHWELPPHALHRDLPYSFPAGTLYPGVDLGAGAAVGTMGAGAGMAMGAGAASAMSYRSGSVSSTVSSPMSPSAMSPSAAAKAAEAAAAVGTTHAPDRNAVLKEGVLGKRGVINSSFQKRLFRLYCDRMEYYNSPSDRMAKGTINLLVGVTQHTPQNPYPGSSSPPPPSCSCPERARDPAV